jgi:hypothetical protein
MSNQDSTGYAGSTAPTQYAKGSMPDSSYDSQQSQSKGAVPALAGHRVIPYKSIRS